MLRGWAGFIWASECIPWPSVILIFSLQRRPAHVTVSPTAVTQRGESLARHRNCNLTQYFSHLQGALKVYIYVLLAAVSAVCCHTARPSVAQWHLVGCWWYFDVRYKSTLTCFIMIMCFSPFLSSSGGDESQVALAVVLADSHDCGVYGCSITNEYGTDTTDFLLSIDSKIQCAWNLNPMT